MPLPHLEYGQCQSHHAEATSTTTQVVGERVSTERVGEFRGTKACDAFKNSTCNKQEEHPDANTACQRKTERGSMLNECVMIITRSAMHIQSKHKGIVSKARQAGTHLMQLRPSLTITTATDNPNPSHTLQTMAPQAAMLLPGFILLHFQHCHATTRPSMQAHASLSQQSVFSTYSTAKHRLHMQAEPQAPAKHRLHWQAVTTSQHCVANNGNTGRKAFPQHHPASLLHSLATNGADAPVNHKCGKHQTVANSVAAHHIEDNSSDICSRSNRSLLQAASTHLP